MNAHLKLEMLIIERREKLTIYARTPTASDFHINNENILIKTLTEIYNGIAPLKYQDLWEACEGKLLIFKQIDADFSGVEFKIRFKKKGELCIQDFNLFDDEF